MAFPKKAKQHRQATGFTAKGDPDGATLEGVLANALRSEQEERRQDAAIAAKERELAQMRADAQRRELESRADTAEREINMFLVGEYSTEFQRMVSGKMSYVDYTYSEAIRNKILDKKEQDL